MPYKYYRLTFRTPKGKSTRWVEYKSKKGNSLVFEGTDKEGTLRPKSHYRKDGTLIDVHEYIICSKKDIIKIQPAKMNLHYAELEVAKKKKK